MSQRGMPRTEEVLRLYRSFLKAGKVFPNYNIREYTKRRARDQFRANSTVTDPQLLDNIWKKAVEDLKIAQRQSVVYSLYARKQRSVMDVPLKEVLDNQAAGAT